MPFPRPDPVNFAQVKKRIDQYLPAFAMRTYFDVGANVGQSSASIRFLYPETNIYAFEPVAETFGALESNLAGHAPFRAFNLALGAADGEATMLVHGTQPINRIITAPKLRPNMAVVKIRRGDDFCSENGVTEISYLKIDTEGHDLEVLRGFQAMLAAQTVDLLEVEAGLNPGNTRHVAFEALKAHLERLNYYLFWLREFAQEYVGRPALRRCNMVFASAKLLDANPRKPRGEAAPA